MALSSPRTIFGIHQITPYNRSTGEFYGTSRVLSGSTFSLSGETIDLFGGSSKYSWQTEDGTVSAELAMTMKEYPDWAMRLFLGKNPTNNSAEATGAVSTITNKYGTSIVNATTGIASIAATAADESDLKFGKYVIKATAADTVSVYCSSNIDFARGADVTFTDDDLLIESGVTIADTGATIALADFGITLTSGSGTIAMAIGDTATFEVRPINAASTIATFGSSVDVYPEFGCLVYAAPQGGNNRMFEIDVLKCKAIGMPIGFVANEFSEAEITVKAAYDSTENAVFRMREIIINS